VSFITPPAGTRPVAVLLPASCQARRDVASQRDLREDDS
jgi:hypothetical protein